MSPPERRWAVALHGGAGVHADRSYARAEACLAGVTLSATRALRSGADALTVVEDAVAAMEESGLFVAGRGSAPNSLGEVELDAAIMDGSSARAGAVAAIQGIRSPVRAARRVMAASGHVLLTGPGATRFALDQGLQAIGDPSAWLTTPDGFDPADLDEGHGTVGAVALDQTGRLAAATSTGGVYGAASGRVGDTPLIGAGTWADERIAVSCTGLGEAFIRCAAAHDLAARIRYADMPLDQAALAVLDRVANLGGDGGLIAVTRSGEIVLPFNTPGMKRASASHSTPAMVGSVGTGMRVIGAGTDPAR